MKFGVVFPQNEIGADPKIVRGFAQKIEQMGYDYLLAYDHILGANPERPGGWHGPYTHEHLFHEVFTLFSHLAALTTTLEFATGILVLPQRETALVAKQAAEVALLSEGRLRLGVGIGWNEVEMNSVGFNFNNRGKRIAEQVQLLRRLWAEPLIRFESEFHHLDDVGILPRPTQPIPIWFGGSADPVLKRMAELGDGWFPNSANPSKLKEALTKIRDHMTSVGRNPAEFGVDVRFNAKAHTPDQWVELIGQLRELGVTHIGMNTMGCGYTVPDGHLDVLQHFSETVRNTP